MLTLGAALSSTQHTYIQTFAYNLPYTAWFFCPTSTSWGTQRAFWSTAPYLCFKKALSAKGQLAVLQ